MKTWKRSLRRLNMGKELSLLGLAAKAGKVVSGGFSVEKAVKSGKAFLVITAEDASENTKKEFRDMCTYYEVPFYSIGSKEELGRAIGKEYRAVLAITEENFSAATVKKIEKARQ
ncbi:MAG TPA: ribosomal L7Ae/L30e/S12e/Gadd45 family protein [Candidatus Blautia pullicola]|uniref:Ribosomal L7Ae/L30e/S12e/Gadd45 family protein n=1 Tax=Candidatus Blautia pullicola TaxID=2838498 RepID=A0A9D2FRN4_9FIRM|nr:ribosomal L7Ae/L30e/S12e/Gadd45 family protein [Candidatus Blautia pullicola]